MVDSREEFSELTPEEMLYKNIKKILALLVSFSIIYIIYFFEKLSNYVPHASQVFNYVDIQDSSMINLENPKVNPDSIKFIYNGSPKNLLNPKYAANMKDLRHWNLGFRENKQLVTKESEIGKDLMRTPKKYNWRKIQEEYDQVLENYPATLSERDRLDAPFSYGAKNCPDKQIIIMIKSALHHFEFRQAARDSWIRDLDRTSNFAYFFTVGKHPSNETRMEMLHKEINEYNDILVGDVIDSYYNVTKKVVMGMRFVVEKCQSAKYVIHIDDDAYVSPYRFERFIYKNLGKKTKDNTFIDKNYIDCGVPTIRASPVIRLNENGFAKHPEWALTKSEYSTDEVPNYCNGPCYGMPISTYRTMFDYTTKINFTDIEKLDDLILSGLIRAQEKWKLYEASGIFCWHLDNKRDGVKDKMIGWYNLGKQHKGLNMW